jgi:hypothetical protein
MARKATRRSTSTASRPRAASPLFGDVLGIAGSLLRNRQEAGAVKINALADAARSFAADLTDIPHIQTYVDAAAEQMETLSDYVSENSMETMVEDASDFAKRYPVATAAFAIAVGFGFTRMMTHHSRSDVAQKPAARKTRTSSKAKATAPRKRSTTKTGTKASGNGRDSSREGVNAS